MSINRNRSYSSCTICQHRRASQWSQFCPDCGAELIAEQPARRPCQGVNAAGEPCPRVALPGHALCPDCETFYTRDGAA